MNPILEVCCGDLASVAAAGQGGATRVELCSALEAGGVTPSAGFMSCARKVAGRMKVHALIRPREGDFVYTPEETAAMVEDILTARRLGLDGVVIGALNPDGTVDRATCDRLIDAAEGMAVTFHRAFDLTSEPFEAVAYLLERGVDRVLTSGLASTALEGADMLRRLQEAAGERLIIMPGSGVKASNAAEILRKSNCREIHASARRRIDSPMTYRHADVAMGAPGADEYSRMTTHPEEVRAIVDAISSIVY